jgi:hypothetical protein
MCLDLGRVQRQRHCTNLLPSEHMAKQPNEDIATFLKRHDAGVLVSVLLELAAQHDSVSDRLARLQLADRPDKLASGFRKTLATWRRSKKFYAYRESRAFGQELERWLAQVEQELLPKDPPAALALFESFIESDAAWFERADDSDGCIGDAVRSACVQWLQAARRCESPLDEWPQRLARLYRNDEYGARDPLLKRADLLLNEAGMRQMVAQFEQEMASTLATCAGERSPSGLPNGVYRISAALSLLSEALRDPDVLVQSVCSYSSQPNGLQKADFVTAYLKADRPADALPWLQDSWERFEGRRQSLLSDTLARLGRTQESAELRLHLFEKSLAVYDYQRWLELLPVDVHPDAHERARQLALGHAEPCVAAELLLALDEAQDAQDKLVGMADAVDGRLYGSLPQMAEALLAQRCYRGATVLYRALLNSILERANSPAYGHAARYWWKLKELDEGTDSLAPLLTHAAYEASVRAKNLRKVSFWTQVNAQGERQSA